MLGYNGSGKPFLDLEELGILVFRDFEKLKNQVFIGAALSHTGFLTAKVGQHRTLLDQSSPIELMTLYRHVIATPSHVLHKTVKQMDVATATEYLKYVTPITYIGTSLSIRNTPDGSYDLKHLRSKVINRPCAKHFPWLDEEIASWGLFSEWGRVILFQNEHHSFTPIHKDWDNQDEFVWIGLTDKKFFVYDEVAKVKHHFTGRAIAFSNADYHGGEPSPHISLSLRVDGVFKQEVREKIAAACQA
jgi:hypothetical protein